MNSFSYIVNIVSGFQKINFGVWNSALFGLDFFSEKFNVASCVIACSSEFEDEIIPKIIPIYWTGDKPQIEQILHYLKAKGYTPSNTLLISHGCWLSPSRVGYQLKRRGYRWLMVPHGMLEPWSMQNGYIKKIIYYHLFEKRFLKKADGIRAVSRTEQKHLQILLRRSVQMVENGVKIPSFRYEKTSYPLVFIFMARLHFKKGLFPLVKSWASVMKDNAAQLIIAGPDEGELEKIKPYLNDRVTYIGSVYGEQKKNLMERGHYFILPSFSEGFPTSVLEAMSFGMIPVISKGCNFPEIFEHELGYQVEPDEVAISTVLLHLKDKEFDFDRSTSNKRFIEKFYGEQVIGAQLFELFSRITNS